MSRNLRYFFLLVAWRFLHRVVWAVSPLTNDELNIARIVNRSALRLLTSSASRTQHTHRCKTSLQWALFGFNMTTDTGAMLDGNVFGCFASVECILLKNISYAYDSLTTFPGIGVARIFSAGVHS